MERWCDRDSFRAASRVDAATSCRPTAACPSRSCAVRARGTARAAVSRLSGTSLGHAYPEVARRVAEQARTLGSEESSLQRRAAPRGRAVERAAGRRWSRVLRELRRRGQRMHDQARRRYGAEERWPRPLPRGQRVRPVPRPHPRHARDGPAAEAGDVPAAPERLPSGRVRRPRRPGRSARRPRGRGDARSGAGRGRGGAGLAEIWGVRGARRCSSSTKCSAGSGAPELVRVRARRHCARHRHDGQGVGQRDADRCVLGASRRGGHVRARRSRNDVRRPAARRERGARDTGRDGTRADPHSVRRVPVSGSRRACRRSTAWPTCAAPAC